MDKTWVEIDRAALRHNVAGLKKWVGRSKLMAVVKANAYGHGLEQVVRAIRTSPAVGWFGVDSLDEALAVMAAGARQPVLILGYVPADRLKEVVRAGFSLIAYDPRMIQRLSAVASRSRPAKIHLKIETGTSRQGVWEADLPGLARLIRRLPNVIVEGASTHYANIEDTADPTYAMDQLKRYQQSLETLRGSGLVPSIRHTAASAAALLYPVTRFDLVRTGLAIYGLWPSDNTRRVVLASGGPRLKPALTWKARLAQVKALPKGTPVSYGLTEKVRRDSVVAVLPVGYWDGLDRKLSSSGLVLVNGRPAKIIGRVCMNMVVIDVTDCGRVRPEDEAVIIGRQGRGEISAEQQAERAGTINYEIVTRINPTIRRILT